MKVSFFIDRPVFSAVISIVIIIIGVIGLTMLPVDQYPQITPPVVKISASYPGASALTVSQAVATPIEQEINGTPGMLYMESNSSNSGGFSATVTFDVSADPDLAAVEIQNRVKLAESRLPAEVIQNGISVEKQAPSQLMTLCLTSSDPKFDEIYLSNFATINVLDVLRRIPGVGRVSNIGSRYYAMQIWAEPDKLANFGLTVQDLQNALKDQNRESAAGVLGQQPVKGLDVTIPITTQGRLSTVSQFEDIVVRANANGSIIRLKKVYIQAEAPYREHKDNINLFFVKASNGAMVPLTSLGNASYTTGPGSIKRFNMFTTAVIRGEAAQGYSSGQAMEIMEQIARDHLPDNIGLEWSGLSYQEKKAGGQTGLVMALVFLFVFLFLAAQYESWTLPVAVLLSLPIAALGAYLGVWICGLENDVYFQIGLVMLVGLAAKNAILIVEFAKVQVDDGEDIVTAAINAARLRFRPILMTSLAFVLGMLPMVLASGPGSASRQAIGTGVFFGMIFAIVLGIILVPFFFVMVYKLVVRSK